jgi:hypothetical protein
MKQNMVCMPFIRTNKKNLKEMHKAMTTILEHHLNNNTFCGDWCPAHLWKDDERVGKSLIYRLKKECKAVGTIEDTP